MKNVMFTLVLMLAICTSGCLEVLSTGQVDALTDNTKLFMSKVDDYQAVANKAFALAERDGAISTKVLDYTVKMSNNVNDFKPQLTEIVKAVDEADNNVISKGKAGIESATKTGLIPQPYGTLAILALSALEIFTLKKRKDEKDRADTVTAKRTAEKAGREKTLREMAALESGEDSKALTVAGVKSLMYENIGVARSANGTA